MLARRPRQLLRQKTDEKVSETKADSKAAAETLTFTTKQLGLGADVFALGDQQTVLLDSPVSEVQTAPRCTKPFCPFQLLEAFQRHINSSGGGVRVLRMMQMAPKSKPVFFDSSKVLRVPPFAG